MRMGKRVRARYAHWSVRLVIACILLFTFTGLFDVVVYTGGRLARRISELTNIGPYLNPEVEKNGMNSDVSHSFDVIINAYMNSGSTYTGQLLGHRPDAFYFYEPLWRLTLWGYYQSNYSTCSTRAPVCRKVNIATVNRNKPIAGRTLDFKVLHDADITAKAVPILVPQRIIDHVINCRLQKLQNLIQPGVTAENRFAGPSWVDYRYCLQRRKPHRECLQQLEINACKPAKHVVTKVIRMGVTGLRSVLENNTNVKLIHLFRDPRAIINSRIETSGYPLADSGYIEIEQNARALCSKMASDLHEGLQLLDDFPGRFRFIQYEDIYSNDRSLINLHSFLGMTLTQRDLNRIRLGSPKIGRGMDVNKRELRRGNNSFWWRTHLSWDRARLVGHVCTDVLQQLGYQQTNSEAEFRNFNQTKLLQNLKFRFDH